MFLDEYRNSDLCGPSNISLTVLLLGFLENGATPKYGACTFCNHINTEAIESILDHSIPNSGKKIVTSECYFPHECEGTAKAFFTASIV